MPRTGDLAHHPGTCPDWESNWRPFGSQTGTQSTEPHQPGLFFFLLFTTVVPVFLPLHFSSQPHPLPTPQLIRTLLSCPRVIHTCSLTNPFPLFPPFPSPRFPLAAVSLFHVSMPVVLVCLLVYFVH